LKIAELVRVFRFKSLEKGAAADIERIFRFKNACYQERVAVFAE